jgi:hypothetical protein
MVKATDESSVSIPLVSRITSLSVSVAIVISSGVARMSERHACTTARDRRLWPLSQNS